MDETDGDLAALQALLDESVEAAGPHLREVFTDDLRLSATELVELLAGIRVIAVATVTGAGEPVVAPVDGIFYRGRFHFGLAPDSVRARHLAARPAVSASHVDGERSAVVAHGRVVRVDLGDPAEAGFRRCLMALYEPRHGPGWIDWAASAAVYLRIEARRLFASRLPGQ
jgi:hypothetical protein